MNDLNKYNNICLFVNNICLKNIEFLDNDKLIEYVKNYINKENLRLHLNGFYRANVFYNKYVGIFIKLIKLEDAYYSNCLDLRVIVNKNSDFYFKTSDYFVISDCSNIRYFNNFFYCLVDDKFENLIKIIEFGEFIYGDEVLKMLNNSIIL